MCAHVCTSRIVNIDAHPPFYHYLYPSSNSLEGQYLQIIQGKITRYRLAPVKKINTFFQNVHVGKP